MGSASYSATRRCAASWAAGLRRLLEGRPAPANMHVMFQAQRLGEGLLEMLGEYLDANPDIHLVCIDTLSKIKPKAKPFENAYDADYDYMGRLKAFADSRGICVLLVHHTRKSKNPEDSFDNINGSTGILGAADFTIVLDKQSRMDDEAGFLLTGRDIEQCERVIRFDKARCRWVMQGTAAQLPASPAYAGYDTALETPYDTAAYNRLLNAAFGEQAEDETPLTLTLLVNEESSFKVSAAQEIAMYLNTARLTVTVEAVPWDTFLTRLESGDFDLYYGECRLTADWDVSALLGWQFQLPALREREKIGAEARPGIVIERPGGAVKIPGVETPRPLQIGCEQGCMCQTHGHILTFPDAPTTAPCGRRGSSPWASGRRTRPRW